MLTKHINISTGYGEAPRSSQPKRDIRKLVEELSAGKTVKEAAEAAILFTRRNKIT